MSHNPTDGLAAARDRFDSIEAILQHYPDVTPAQLDDLRAWFRNEASAFEVASLASKEHLAVPYRQFRADHIDNFRATDVVIGVLALVALACFISGLAWLA
ncbi:MAG: hypothetical protein IE933_12245 [Sphingomonadales bacterium]|nr:hypothetical protein [Sphingomonadales bacterium]MBD3773017.1 hypothetical protein [Paracoccaceae bacterium]